jgi:hypothetical protein
VKITFEGRDWEYDEDEVDTKQATVLYMVYKMTLHDWIAGVAKVDQRSLHFTYWLMLQQNGVVKPIADCNPKPIAFAVAYGEAREVANAEEEARAAAEAEAAAVAVPTIPSLPGGPLSSVPAIPTDMTPQHPAQVPIPSATAY